MPQLFESPWPCQDPNGICGLCSRAPRTHMNAPVSRGAAGLCPAAGVPLRTAWPRLCVRSDFLKAGSQGHPPPPGVRGGRLSSCSRAQAGVTSDKRRDPFNWPGPAASAAGVQAAYTPGCRHRERSGTGHSVSTEVEGRVLSPLGCVWGKSSSYTGAVGAPPAPPGSCPPLPPRPGSLATPFTSNTLF